DANVQEQDAKRRSDWKQPRHPGAGRDPSSSPERISVARLGPGLRRGDDGRRVINALPLILAAIVAWLAIGALGLARPRNLFYVGRVLFTAGAGIGLLLALVALLAMGQVAQTIVLPLGLPDLPFHLRLDALSAFFLLLLGATAAGISVFSAGYFR